jgi:hypothetical protein
MYEVQGGNFLVTPQIECRILNLNEFRKKDQVALPSVPINQGHTYLHY